MMILLDAKELIIKHVMSKLYYSRPEHLEISGLNIKNSMIH